MSVEQPDQAGWHQHPRDGGWWRYYTGTEWSERTIDAGPRPMGRPSTPVRTIAIGVALLVASAVLAEGASEGVSAVVGSVLLAAGVSVTLVGAIAAGVRSGLRLRDHERQQSSEVVRPLPGS